MAFEVFEDTRLRTKEFISITDNKTFGLPRTFLNSQGISSEHKAVILYDADEKKIALSFTLNDPKFGLAVRIPNEKQGGMVVARSFFDAKNIDPRMYSGRYDFEKVPLASIGVEKEGFAYVITLAEKSAPEAPSNTDLASSPWEFDDTPIKLNEIPF